MKIIDAIARILLIIGGLNWGLVALNYNVVDAIFGAGSDVTRIIYGLVGLAAIYLIFRCGSCCSSNSCSR
jgi:uncharacterized membrane protein YuzA (DUF378 family)